MGRRHFLKEIFNMDFEDLRAMYIKLGTIKKVSDKLGVTDRTVKNWFKEGDIVGLKHETRVRKSTNKLMMWAKEHPDIKLPRSPLKISKMTGIPLSAVKSFFTRRKQRTAKWLTSFPNLGTLNITLKSVDGSYVPTRSIDVYNFKVDPYSLTISVYGTRKTGSVFNVLMSPKKFEKLFAIVDAVPSQDLSEPAPQ